MTCVIKVVINCYYILNFISTYLHKLMFSLIFSPYNSLSFASPLANPKIYKSWQFTECLLTVALCQVSFSFPSNCFFVLSYSTALKVRGATSVMCCERPCVSPAILIHWGSQAISLLADKKSSFTREAWALFLLGLHRALFIHFISLHCTVCFWSAGITLNSAVSSGPHKEVLLKCVLNK